MALPDLDPDDIPPPWMVVVLSLVFPGAAQLALGEKKRGLVFVAITVVLMALFFVVFAQLVGAFWSRMQSGADPIDESVTGHLIRIGYVLGAGVVEVIMAAVDAVSSRRRIVEGRS